MKSPLPHRKKCFMDSRWYFRWNCEKRVSTRAELISSWTARSQPKKAGETSELEEAAVRAAKSRESMKGVLTW